MPQRRGRARAPDSPVPGDCKGERHACERQCMDALAGPQRSMDGGASRHERPGQTEKPAKSNSSELDWSRFACESMLIVAKDFRNCSRSVKVAVQ
jgi:hypothetical protein